MLQVTKPPMGWNSWNVYLDTPDEAEMKAQMRYMAANLLPCGYRYFTLDAHWYGRMDKKYADGSTVSWDDFGRPIPQINKYPSSRDGSGFKKISDYAHSIGLKFGLHMMRGMNEWMLGHGCCVKGTNTPLEDLIDYESPCHWGENGWYGVKLGHPDAQRWYDSLFEMFSEWGVDFVKYDDIAYPLQPEETEMICRARKSCGRDMVLSLSPGITNVEDGEFYSEHADMWRISGDFWDNWEHSLRRSFDYLASWNARIGCYGWPDADMLPLGWLCEYNSVRGVKPRLCRFNTEEMRSLFTLFSIAKSPLILTCNLLRNDDTLLKIQTQPDCIAVNQNGKNPLCLRHDEQIHVWRSSANGKEYLAVFNVSEQEQTWDVEIPAELVGSTALDVWNQDVYVLDSPCCQLPISAHSVVFLRIISVNG